MDLNPYSTVLPLLGPLEGWIMPDDAIRLAAYTQYEAMYDNVPDTFKLVQRGSESSPIYLPNARTLIEAKNRYLAKRWNFGMDPKLGTDVDRLTLTTFLQNLFRREKVWSKFSTQKRYGLIRGDSVWQIVADDEKPEGRRLSVYEIDPGSYFPIADPWNPDKLSGVHIVDQVLLPDGQTIVIKRQTYRKTETGRISYELSWFEPDGWDDRETSSQKLKPTGAPEGEENEAIPVTELDPRITSIPVYHVKNNRKPNTAFGTSDLQGYEVLIAAVNQAITDEDLSLALEGLGLYFTTSGPPVDDDGNEINWKIGPGWVVEGDDDSTFERVNGVASVEPSLAHIGKLESSMREAAGIPDIAVGKVDTQVAESGISLAFQMGPLLSANEEKEVEILSTMDQMLYDLVTMWLPVHEGLESPARAVSLVDDPLPVNRKAFLEEIILMLSNSIISIPYAQQLISEKLGFDFPDEMLADIVSEQAALAQARNYDPFAARVASELEDQQ